MADGPANPPSDAISITTSSAPVGYSTPPDPDGSSSSGSPVDTSSPSSPQAEAASTDEQREGDQPPEAAHHPRPYGRLIPRV